MKALHLDFPQVEETAGYDNSIVPKNMAFSDTVFKELPAGLRGRQQFFRSSHLSMFVPVGSSVALV